MAAEAEPAIPPPGNPSQTPGEAAPAAGLADDDSMAPVDMGPLGGADGADGVPADDDRYAPLGDGAPNEPMVDHSAAGLIDPSDNAQPFHAGGEREDTSQAIQGAGEDGIVTEAPLSDPHAIAQHADEAPLSDPREVEPQIESMATTLGGIRKVRAVDFRRPTKFTRDQMRRLESAHDGFCRAASTRLSAELRVGVEIDVTTSDQLSYAAVMSEIPEDSIVTILDVDPIDTQVALIFELPLAVNLIDRLLGAVIARTSAPVGLTDLEAVVLQRVIRSIVEPLSATWQELAGVRFSIATAASTPANAQFAAPSEPCLLLSGEAHIDGTSSPIIFCLPHASVEPLMERLEKAHVRNRAVDQRAATMLRQAVSGVDVELRAEVGRIEMPVADVLALRPGDVIGLRAPAADGVAMLAGDVRSYMATPGRNNAARAIQITHQIEEPT